MKIRITAPNQHFNFFRLTLFCAALFSFGMLDARAGLTLEMNVIRYDQNGFYFSPNLTTNSTPPNIPFGAYYIASSGYPNSGSGSTYRFDTNGFNLVGGGSWGYGDFDSMVYQLTNGDWSIVYTNLTTTNNYHFNVTVNIDSNALPPVTVIFPANGAVNVVEQPTFTWQGPANFSDLVVYEYNTSDSLPTTQTNWSSSRVLYQGKNTFTAHYDSNSVDVVVSSVPVDGDSNAISSWVSTAHLQDYISSQFMVGTVSTLGGSHTLVARYTWDGTNADGSPAGTDVSGNGYDMDLAGGGGSQGGVNSTTDGVGGSRGIQFHNGDGGSLGYVGWNITPAPMLNALAGSFSVSCWIKTTQNFAWDDAPAYYGAGIVSADNNGQANDVIPMALTGSKLGFNTGGSLEDVTMNSSVAINDGNYHHIVVTRNQATGQKTIYIDGVLDSFASGSENSLNDPKKLTIGALADAWDPDGNNFNYYNGFDGEMDDLQVYSGVLSASEVSALYGSPGSTIANGGGNVLIGGHSIVARYDFEQPDGSGVDSSGRNNDANCGGGSGDVHDVSSSDAAIGSYSRQFFGDTFICFSPGADSYNNLSNTLSASFTVSAWVKTINSVGNDYDNAYFGAAILFAYNNNNSTVPMSITGSKVAITVNDHNGNSTTLHSQTSVNDGKYHQVVVSRNQADGTLKVYVDGNLEGTTTGTVDPFIADSTIYLGGGWANDYIGLLDDVQIYSGVLGDSEVTSLFTHPGTVVADQSPETLGPVAHYDFDEGMAQATDISGNGNNIIHAGNFGGGVPSISSDSVSGAGSVSFDGGSYLTASSALLPTLASDFTVSLWLKTGQSYGNPDDFAWQGAAIISADSPDPSAKDVLPVALTGGHVAFNVGAEESDDTLNSSAAVNDNSWHHIVVTRQRSTGERQIYIDGILDNSSTGTTELLNSPVLLTIGAKADASNSDPASPDDTGSNGYEGSLDDIQIYDRVLSADEVSFLHNNPGTVVAGSKFDAALNTAGLSWIAGGDVPWFVETTNTYDGISAAQSGAITDDGTSWIETTVPSDGQLSFYWKVSSEYSYDLLHFFINGAEQDVISGEVDWNQENYTVHAGDTLRWEYTKDGSDSDDIDAGFLDQVSYIPNNSQNFNVALGTQNWNWTLSGDSHWSVENTNTHDSYFAAQSGPVVGSQYSKLQTTVTGPGTLSFWWTTMGDYDGFGLEFAIDGNYYNSISGYNGYWMPESGIFISSGQHTISWSVSDGSSLANAGFLDQVSFSSEYAPVIYNGPLDGTVSNASYNANLAVKLGSNAVLVVQLDGNPAPFVRWYRNGILLTNNANSATLVVTNIQFSDAGYYQLQASNYLGVTTSSSVYVKVYQDTDLQPLSISAPPVVSSGTIIPFVWTVTNTGPATVSGFYDTLSFAVPVVTPDFTQGSLWSIYNGNPIPPASTYTITNTIYRFPNIPAGIYSLVLNVDANNYIIETNETNNSLSNLTVTVINPDLQPGNFHLATANAVGNSTIQFTYNITNNGPGILDGQNFYDEIFISTNAVWDSSAINLKQVNQAPSLGVGAYLTTTNTLTLPVTPSGDYYLILHVDHYGFQDIGTVWETSETNNYAVVPVHITQSDLIPTNLVAPAFVSSRQTLPMNWNDYNQGDGPATNTTFNLLADQLYLSTNQFIDSSAIRLGNYYSYDFYGNQYYYSQDYYWAANLAPGQAFTNSQNIVIPNVPAGNYYFLLAVDTQNAVREIVETNNLLVQPVTLGTLDLTPVAFNVPPAANTRSTIPVTWAVTNLGNGTVYPQWVDRVFISTHSTYDNTAILLGEFVQTNSLAGASSYSVSNAITLNGVGAGNYYLLLYVDAATNVAEVDHNNNVVSVPLVINTPDLVATSLAVATSFSSQEPFSVVYSVTNMSGVTAYSGWSDHLYLSPDGILETNNIPIIFGYDYYSGQPQEDVFHGSDLLGGDGYSQLVSGSIPAVPAGDYYVLLQANGNQFFVENNTQDNLVAKPVHINNPDLVLTNFTAPTSLVLTQYNQHVEVDWSVLNQGAGGAYAGWSDNIYLSPTNVLDTNAVSIGGSGQSPVLGSGQSYLSFATPQLPNGIQGNYYLLLQANDGHSLYESTYTNNLVVRPINLVVPPVPVMSVISVDSPADAWSGQSIYVTWTLTNSGTAAVSGTFYDVVYFCSSSNGDGAQPYGQFQFNGQIPPGQSIVRQQKISLPINLQGTFWVALQTDVNHEIFEFNYRTNDFLMASHPLQIHLTPTPNLVINNVDAPTNMFSGGEGTVSWVETNSGSGATSAAFWDDAIYLCDTTNFYTANYRMFLGAPNNISYLNPGDSYSSSADITLPRGISGTFYFIVYADSGNNVFEWTNENDNMLTSAPVFVAPTSTPDLQTITVQPPHDAFSGQAVSVKYAITNFGLGQTQPGEVQWNDRVYISTNTTLNGSAIYLGDIVHNGGLTPQSGYETTANVTLPVGVSGDYYFIITADIYNQVYEAAFEDNNDKTAAYVTHIALTPPPDLEANVLQLPTNVYAGHALTVIYSVDNAGTTITPNSGWNDNFYLSANSVFDPNHATYIGQIQHNGALTPGAGYTNAFSIVLPIEIAGTNYIFVRSDADNYVFELNKTNNLAGATNPVVVQFRPADLAPISLTAPITVNAGGAILVNWAVTNIGPGDTAVAQWSDRLILSQNILPGAPSDVQLLDLTHTGLLATNGVYAVSNLLAQIPSTVAAGTYQLFLITDVGQWVLVDTNRNNNVYGPVPITITAHSPDLQTTAASAPANALSGSTVTVNWTVSNLGDLPANFSSWYDTVYLSRDGLLGPDAILLGYQRNVRSLATGEFYTNSLAVTLPVNVSSNYYFVVTADGYNNIQEAAENNNSYIMPVYITLSPGPDIAVTRVVTPTTAYEGQSFHLTWIVKNVGSARATGAWYDVAYLSTDQIPDQNLDTYLGYAYQSHDLAPGESYTNSADFQIPQGLSGPFYVFVAADTGHALNERGQLANNSGYNPQAMLVQLLPPVDLLAGQVTIPVNAVPGRNLTVSYTVKNQGSNAAIGAWTDSLFISADTNWDIGDKLFATVTHAGDVLPGGAYTNTVTAALPGVLPGDYHLIVRSDILNHLTEADKSNNVAASLNSSALDMPQLTFGVPANDVLDSGQSAFYKFDATNGQTIHLQFTSPAMFSDNEVFVKFGAMPDSGTFDAAANAPFVADPEIYLAVTNTGTYYVLVKCNYVPVPTAYSLLAEVLPFTVREVQPNLSSDAGQTTFFVRGALFDTNTQFTLQQQDQTISAQSVYLTDSTAAYVTFSMSGATNGEWDLSATMTDGASNAITTTLTNAVLVGSMDPVEADVSIDGPLAVSEPSMGYVTHSCLVDYGNSGYSDIAPPLILVQGAEDTVVGTTPYDLETKTIELLGRSLVGPPGILRSQTQASKVLYYRGGGTHVQVVTILADDTRPMTEADWQDVEHSVRPAGVADADWLNFWVNIRPRLGSTWGDYVQFLDRLAEGFPAEQREVSAMISSLYTNQPGFQASASVSGVLLGSTNGLPMAGVQVGLVATNANNLSGFGGSVITDQNGRFTIPYAAPGMYNIAVAGTPYGEFDMDRDGTADLSSPTIVVSNKTDVVNQIIYLFQPAPTVLPTNDADATLTVDNQGMLHAFWYHEDRLWHARNSNGNWVDANQISTNFITGFTVGTGTKLIDGHTPGIIVVWTEQETNGSSLFYAVGQNPSNSGYSWSQPVRLAQGPTQDYAPAVVVRNDGLAVITYLKRGLGFHDDSDVYFSVVNIASGALEWMGSANALNPQPQDLLSANDMVTTATKITVGYTFRKDFSAFGNVFQLAASLDGEAEANGCNGTGTVKATGGLNFNTENLAGGIFAAGDMGLIWNVDPDQCAWKYNESGSTANLHFGGNLEIKNAVFNMFKLWPPTITFAAATEDFMNGFAKWAHVELQNSVIFGIQVNMNDCHWTEPPLVSFGIPTVGSSDCEIKAAVKFGVVAQAGRTDMDINLNAQPQTFTSSDTPNGLSSTLELVFKFGLKPDIKPISVTASGTVTFELWGFHPTLPAPSLSYNFNGQPMPMANLVRPKDGSTTLPGWTFVYAPALSVGTTNVYGTNAVLSNVATDTANDGAPALALDAGGTPYQVWYKDGDPFSTNMGSQIYVADFNGVSWNSPAVIPGTRGFNSYVSAATDASGHRLAVWVHATADSITTNATADEFFAARNATEVYYSTFDGSSWSAPQAVATTAGPDSDLQLSHQTNGDVLAVWIYNDSADVKHLMASHWTGGTWTTPEEITTGQLASPTAQQAGGITYVMWTDVDQTNHNRSISLSRNQDGYWSKPEAFAPVLPPSASAIVSAVQSQLVQPRSLFNFPIDEKCCRCKGKLTDADPDGVKTRCGISQNGYDYENCKRLFIYKPCQVRPMDPNNIVGPVGYGPEHFVPAGTPLGYTIQYENDPVLASAPAKRVMITMPLDDHFDPRTFRLGDFGFGGMIFNIPSGSAFYQTRLDLSATKGYYVDLIAGVDIVNHQAFWTLTTIDPATGDLPQNALIGFLPPDTNAPDGEGFVSCSITPLTGVTNGSPVSAKATIVFDNQPPMDTPSAVNTLQTGQPMSSVLPLPAVTMNPTFNVSWQGVVTNGNSGIASYDIYAAENGGAAYPWLQGSTLTQAPFVGQPGITYGFYSIAHDNVGNIQPTPTNADASIYISSNLPPVIRAITNLTVAPENIVSIKISATDPNGDGLTYSLISAPSGATLNATNGAFRWKPTRALAGTTNYVTVGVTDNGLPPLSTNQTFSITVLDYLELALGETNLEGGQTASIPVTLSSSDGVTNLTFTVQVPADLLTNWSLATPAPQIGTSTLQNNLTNILVVLGTSAGQTLQGTQQISSLTFSAVTNQVSGFITLPVTSLHASKAGGVGYANYLTRPGTVIVVQNEPLIRANIGTNQTRTLQLYGKLNAGYQLLYSTNLSQPAWQTLLNYTQTNGVITLPVDSSNPVIFYRLHAP